MNKKFSPPLLSTDGKGTRQFGPLDVAGWETLIVTFSPAYPLTGGNTPKQLQLDWSTERLPQGGKPTLVQLARQTWDVTSPGIGVIAFPVMAPWVTFIVNAVASAPWALLDVIGTARRFDRVQSLGINAGGMGGEDHILLYDSGPLVIPNGVTTSILPPYIGPATVFFQPSTGAYRVSLDATDVSGAVLARLYSQAFPAAAVDVPPVTIEVPPRIIQVTFNNTSGGNLTIAGSIVANS